MDQIWFHYVNRSGDSDTYSVLDWEAAQTEAAKLLEPIVSNVCDPILELQIRDLLKVDWKHAIELYNRHNVVCEFIGYHQGSTYHS